MINLCALPFCHDDSVILTTRAGLRNALTQFLTAAAKDGARTHPRVDSAYVIDIRKEVMFGMVPINIYFTAVNLKFSVQGKEATRLIILALQLTDEARVVGINISPPAPPPPSLTPPHALRANNPALLLSPQSPHSPLRMHSSPTTPPAPPLPPPTYLPSPPPSPQGLKPIQISKYLNYIIFLVSLPHT